MRFAGDVQRGANRTVVALTPLAQKGARTAAQAGIAVVEYTAIGLEVAWGYFDMGLLKVKNRIIMLVIKQCRSKSTLNVTLVLMEF